MAETGVRLMQSIGANRAEKDQKQPEISPISGTNRGFGHGPISRMPVERTLWHLDLIFFGEATIGTGSTLQIVSGAFYAAEKINRQHIGSQSAIIRQARRRLVCAGSVRERGGVFARAR